MAKAPLPEQFAIASDYTDAQSLSRSTQNIPLTSLINKQMTKDDEKWKKYVWGETCYAYFHRTSNHASGQAFSDL
jgi:hypothetical protein